MPATTTTRDIGPSVVLPINCITASSLRLLASALDRIAAFHTSRGGQSPDAPCLTHVIVDEDIVCARVKSGDRTLVLRFDHGVWTFG